MWLRPADEKFQSFRNPGRILNPSSYQHSWLSFASNRKKIIVEDFRPSAINCFRLESRSSVSDTLLREQLVNLDRLKTFYLQSEFFLLQKAKSRFVSKNFFVVHIFLPAHNGAASKYGRLSLIYGDNKSAPGRKTLTKAITVHRSWILHHNLSFLIWKVKVFFLQINMKSENGQKPLLFTDPGSYVTTNFLSRVYTDLV